MKSQKRNKLNTIILLLSIALFIYVLFLFGNEAFEIIKLNINLTYLGLVMLIAVISFIPYTMRFKVILEAYGKKVPFWMLFRHTLAAFAVSYVTPFSRLGGEPIRIYMLKKEANVDYKTGSTAVILDKYVEVLGGVLYIIAGLILVLTLPQSPLSLKIILGSMALIMLLVLGSVYVRGKKDKGYFSSLFLLFRLQKIKRIFPWLKIIKEIEVKMNKFFRYHKKNFLLSCFYYLVTALIHIILIKVLLLGLGFNFSLSRIILIIAAWGLLNSVPTPAGLGALEAGQSALFIFLEGNGSIGFAMTLILRAGYFVMIALGFIFLSQFSRRQMRKRSKYLKAKTILEKSQE